MIRLFAKITSWISLGALVVPALFFLNGRATLDQVKTIMLIATVIWFVTASLWMWRSDAKVQDNQS